ncbi:GspH/FimT family pseudopilin [Psychromonas arctica]|uniref:GspH/FimT family pseudopilin n=1 Tax=Psychromonas arctica TaxID=168275 RepID=UPI0004223614|nr:GspH/FimT family pseudopilin [Psychromonas arctica]
MTRFTTHKKDQGFTLVELIITIAIAAILLSIVVPSFANLIESSKTRATRDALVSSIYSGKEKAQSEGFFVYLCPTSDGSTCTSVTDWGSDWLVYEDKDASATLDLSNGDIIVTHLTSKTNSIKSNVAQIRFAPTGHATANTFQICSNLDNSVVYQIQLSVMGRVSFANATGNCS